MKMGHKQAPYPEWMYKQCAGKTKDGIELVRRVKPGVVYIQYFDHFDRPNIIPRRIGEKDKWG